MSKTYNNLAELLNDETAYRFGRMLYKYTDCGPWTNFIVRDKPERIERYAIEIRETVSGLRAKSMTQDPAADAIQFLGFEPDGSNTLRWRSRKAMQKRVHAFFAKERDPLSSIPWTLKRNALCIGCLRIELSRNLAANTRDVYYEDEEANTTDIPGCIGIEIGSIVEGCDNGIDGRTLLFPFTDEEFDAVVKQVNDDACTVWDWANVRYDRRGRKNPNGKTMAERGCDWPLL